MIAIKPKACKTCGTSFSPWSSTQTVCGRVCAGKLVKTEKVAEKAKDKARKEALQPLREVIAEAQEAFNLFIRTRDAALPCVSCDETNPPMTVGGQWDAGHFINRGAHPELRFDEDNCHKQCKACNGGSGKFKHHERTVAEKYEERLTARIGAERVERLKGPHEVVKWGRDTLRQLKVIYRAKARQLKKEQE